MRDDKAKHRKEIARFAKDVEGDEVVFVSCSYRESCWRIGRATRTAGFARMRTPSPAVLRLDLPTSMVFVMAEAWKLNPAATRSTNR